MPAGLRILGVYRLDVTPEVFAAQLPMYGDEEQCRGHFSSVVLIEAIVEDGTGFSFDGVTQLGSAYPDIFPQAPYDEGLLSLDGESLLSRKINCVKGVGPLRFAFYMHYWDPSAPLKWAGEECVCPQPQTMPVRLEMLMPYRPCD